MSALFTAVPAAPFFRDPDDIFRFHFPSLEFCAEDGELRADGLTKITVYTPALFFYIGRVVSLLVEIL